MLFSPIACFNVCLNLSSHFPADVKQSFFHTFYLLNIGAAFSYRPQSRSCSTIYNLKALFPRFHSQHYVWHPASPNIGCIVLSRIFSQSLPSPYTHSHYSTFLVCYIFIHVTRFTPLCCNRQKYIQGVPGGMDKTSGECSLCWTIPI